MLNVHGSNLLIPLGVQACLDTGSLTVSVNSQRPDTWPFMLIPAMHGMQKGKQHRMFACSPIAAIFDIEGTADQSCASNACILSALK